MPPTGHAARPEPEEGLGPGAETGGAGRSATFASRRPREGGLGHRANGGAQAPTAAPKELSSDASGRRPQTLFVHSTGFLEALREGLEALPEARVGSDEALARAVGANSGPLLGARSLDERPAGASRARRAFSPLGPAAPAWPRDPEGEAARGGEEGARVLLASR